MSSLQRRIEELERDLLADPPRISAYHDLPFALFRYDPEVEFGARHKMKLLATRLADHGRRVRFISLAKILWKAIEETESLAAIARAERERGFENAQETVGTLISDPEFVDLPTELARRMRDLDPSNDCVFLVRTAALAPAIYRCAKLLEELHGKTMVPTILFYPGTVDTGPDGKTDQVTSLRFMGMPERRGTGTYSYRVKIY